MQSAYVAVSFSHRHQLSDVLDTIEDVLRAQGLDPQVFVRNYHFNADQVTEMMQTALNAIQQADLLIAEVSHKAIGVGLEAGYAHALGKPIVYLRQSESEHSTTIAGIADHTIIYRDVDDLKIQLIQAIQLIKRQKQH